MDTIYGNRRELNMEELDKVTGALSWEDVLEFIVDTLNSMNENDRA